MSIIFFLKNNFLQHIMMESLIIDKRNIIKDIKNIFRLKEELNYSAIRNIRNLFRLEKKNIAIKDRIHRDIKNLFEHEEDDENCYKLVSK